ncbi:MAG: HYR domain-containing protein [Lewinellaceae bacterium]|nr:HYR domain-containing protein [Lewinellaceae bacterium]
MLLRPSACFAQCSLTCNDGLQVSLDATGQALITTGLIAPNASTSCPGALQLKLFTPQGLIIPNNILHCDHIGQTITAEVKHLASGNSCTGTLEVRDALPPVLACPDKFIFCNQDPAPEAVGFPVMTDNCTPSNNLIFNYFDEVVPLSCGTLQAGVPVTKRIDRSWFAEDEYGNSSTCQQKIWLKHITLPAIVFPANMDGQVNPSLVCGQDPYDLSLTGQPSIAGIPIDNSPDCEFGITYADQVINICPPAGFSVLRTWTAVDFCNGTISSRLQIIKVEDKTPPAITAPDDLTVGTDGFLCTGTVSLPQPLVTDDCSAVMVSAFWAYGSGFGPFFGVGQGQHLVVYTATDACGNTSSASFHVTVLDSSPPQAICSSGSQISLSANGSGFVSAGSIDQGSFDNCGPVTLSLSRDDSIFTTLVQVSCADIGAPLPLTLKVTDAMGFENLCVTEVTVRDFLKPTLICPPNISLNCLQDHLNLSLTGQATATDNCELQSLVFEDFTNTGGCNTGLVQRVWKATDHAGNTKSCVQQIVLNVVSNVTVTFPPDVTVNTCSGPGAILPPATGQPLTSGQFCSPLSVTFTDETFPDAPAPYCFRIFRTWKVIDFCIYDPNDDSTGIWKHIQVLDITDDEAPELTIPADITVSTGPADCQAQVTLLPAIATDCGDWLVSNNSPFAAAGDADASGVYPSGTHQVVFTATDNCGNSAQKTLNIAVEDHTSPVAVCNTDLAVGLDSAGLALVDVALIDGGSSDNCSAQSALTFALSADQFNCQSIGIQQIVMTVTDQSGNVSSCSTAVNIIDPTGACLPPPPVDFTVEGTIRTPPGEAVADIPVTLTGDGFSATTYCDTNGRYYFEDVPGSNLYNLKPHNDANWLNGVSTFDLVLISKHILGLSVFDTPHKIIAADANHSGSVTTFDIVQLRKLILGLADSIPGNTSWRFVAADYPFPVPSDPFADVFPEQTTLNGLTANILGKDFTGIKIGDLNDSSDPADARSATDTLHLNIPDINLPVGPNTLLPVSLNNWRQLDGFQFELTFDTTAVTLEKIVFSQPELLNDANVAVRPEGVLALSWDHVSAKPAPGSDALLFTLHLTMKRKTGSIQVFDLAKNRLFPEAYLADNEMVVPVNLYFEKTIRPMGQSIGMPAVYPNPSCGDVTIPFVSPGDADMQVIVEDAAGSVVLQKQVSAATGYNECAVRRAELPGAGVYFYRISAKDLAPGSGRFVVLCDR